MTPAFDLAIVELLTGSRLGSPEWHAFVRDYVAGNDLLKGGPLVAVLWWFWFQPHLEQVKRRQLVVATAVGALVAAAVSRCFAHLVPFRQRPFSTPGLNLEMPLPQLWEIKGGSFPSDHTALAFALVTGIFLVSPPLGLALGAYVLVFVGFPRVYLGIHWATDIAGGMLVGIAVMLLLSRPRIRAALSRPALCWQERSPALFYAGMFLVAFGLMTRFQDFRSVGGFVARAGFEAIRATTSPPLPEAPEAALRTASPTRPAAYRMNRGSQSERAGQ